MSAGQRGEKLFNLFCKFSAHLSGVEGTTREEIIARGGAQKMEERMEL